MHRVENQTVPSIFLTKFCKSSHPYPTNLSAHKFLVPTLKLKKSKYRVSIRDPLPWNKILTAAEKTKESLPKFRNTIKEELNDPLNVNSDYTLKNERVYIVCLFFFSIWIFFHEHSQFTGQQGKGEGIYLTPLYHFHPLHRHLDISRAITAKSSPLHIAGSRTRTGNLWFPSASR